MLQMDKSYQVAFDPEINEEQIYNDGMEEWVETVAMLWDAIGKDVEQDTKVFNRYCKQLRDVPLGLLEIGVNYAIKNNTYKTIPAVGLIYEGIRAELAKLNMPPKTDMDTLIERWMDTLFQRSILLRS
jgi:hypothetical protein